MPDILIHVKQTWEQCADCPLYGWAEVGHCTADGHDVSFYAVEWKPSDCQITKLSPHWDLISLDMALDECKKPTIYDLTDVPDFLRELQVIIPAERSE